MTYIWSIFLSRHNKQESHWGHLLWLHTIDTDQEKGQKGKCRSFSVFGLVLHSLVKQVSVCDFRSGPIIVVHLWSWEVKILFFCLQGIVHSKLPHSLILHNYYSSWSCLLIFPTIFFLLLKKEYFKAAVLGVRAKTGCHWSNFAAPLSIDFLSLCLSSYVFWFIPYKYLFC